MRHRNFGCRDETGCIAVLKGGHPGKTVGLREDIDALPIVEQTGLPFASENEGVMHACGHDIHQTVLMYTAKCLSEIREELYGDVLFIFQPAEEALYGALDTMATKFYEKCHPDVLAGLHCSPEWDAGTIGVIKGPANASSDFLYITVYGKAGHGAHPENFVDPIMISGYLLAELQTVVSRVNRPVYPAVLTFGSIHGGKAGNVVPEKVEMVGTLRSLDPGSRKLMHEEINRIVEHGAAAFRGKGEVKWADGMPPLINDAKVIDAIEKAAAETIGRRMSIRFRILLRDQMTSPGCSRSCVRAASSGWGQGMIPTLIPGVVCITQRMCSMKLLCRRV